MQGREHPVLTFVTLSFNSGRAVVELLDQVLSVVSLPLQVICIDDGSTDGESPQVLSQYAEGRPVELYLLAENLGIPGCLNAALSRAQGEFFAFMGDDLILPGKFEQDVAFLRREPDRVALVHSVMQLMDDRGVLYPSFIPCLPYPVTVDTYFSLEQILVDGGPVSAPTVTFRTSALRAVGGWDPDLLYEDLGMWFKLAASGKSFGFRPEISVRYRMRADSASSLWKPGSLEYQVKLYSRYSDLQSGYRRMNEMMVEAIVQSLRGKLLLAPILRVYISSPRFSRSLAALAGVFRAQGWRRFNRVLIPGLRMLSKLFWSSGR